MKTYTYGDNSNLFIEGRRVSAVAKGLAPNIYDAMNNRVLDQSWDIDYGKLHTFLCGTDKKEIGGARLWGSPPPSDSFWKMVERKGFGVQTFERNAANKEKKLDMAIGHRMTKEAYTIIDKANDEIALVAGDKDFVPVVVDLVAEGFTVVVVFWDHAAKELKDVASSFLSLNSHLNHIAKA